MYNYSKMDNILYYLAIVVMVALLALVVVGFVIGFFRGIGGIAIGVVIVVMAGVSIVMMANALIKRNE
jgi:hypothetical protein